MAWMGQNADIKDCFGGVTYHAHINVEWCNRSKAIKYLNKRPDRATVVIQENVENGDQATLEKVVEVDEIKNFLNCRYLVPCEAVWCMFSFDIHYFYTSVMKLNFHLPNQNPITLCDSECLLALLEREGDILYKKRKLFRYPDLQLTTEQIHNYCLVEIQELLNRSGRSLAEFQDIPHPNPNLLTNMDNRLIREALDFDMNKSKKEHQQLHPLLNPEQRLIYEQVIESVNTQRGLFYFVYGPGGTRKTFL
ncbi:ATP-dependent DNA helicase PIF1-like protein, partial [Tanacetum coccineum]